MRLQDPDEEPGAPKPWPPPEGLPPGQDPYAHEQGPEEPHFLLAEERPPERWRMTTDRAVMLSVIFHVVLVILVMLEPLWEDRRPRGGPVSDPLGLIKLLEAPPGPEPIPAQFFPSPGAPEKVSGQSPRPSDANRQAHGGDPELAPAETPKSIAEAGIQDLASGTPAPEPIPAQGRGVESPARKDLEAGALTDLTRRHSNEPEGQAVTPEGRTLSGLPGGSLTDLRPAAPPQGDGGGGFSSEGGFVDSGPVSFDTVGYDWGPYAAEMIRKIKRNWDVPALARYGVKGWVKIRFFIRRDGTVEGTLIVASSGVPPFDNAAFQAILRSSPLRPLPSDLSNEREGVTITFYYNIDPGDALG